MSDIHSPVRDWKAERTETTCNEVWFIQTDACHEPGDASVFFGVGAVLFNPAGRAVKYFSQQLSEKHVALLNPLKKKTAIYESEFGAVEMLLDVDFCWGEMLRLKEKWGKHQAPASIPSVKKCKLCDSPQIACCHSSAALHPLSSCNPCHALQPPFSKRITRCQPFSIFLSTVSLLLFSHLFCMFMLSNIFIFQFIFLICVSCSLRPSVELCCLMFVSRLCLQLHSNGFFYKKCHIIFPKQFE